MNENNVATAMENVAEETAVMVQQNPGLPGAAWFGLGALAASATIFVVNGARKQVTNFRNKKAQAIEEQNKNQNSSSETKDTNTETEKKDETTEENK